MERATVEQLRSIVRQILLAIASLHGYWTAFALWRHRQRAIAALLTCNDRMLSDIGIGRSEIEYVVRDRALDRRRSDA